nr:uncharacterized protein CFP56_77292 [Quercus suber]
MAEELEVLWQNLKVTDEEEVSVNLGRECTRATKEKGEYCLVMKVLSRRGVMLDALRKNIRMLWKPNKGIQISVIEEEMYLVEFGDERDKRRVMEMSPWHYEKQLVLLQDFEGDQDPKDIVFKWAPFWVQIYNLPLKHRTRETGMAIGASLGEVIEVDVADSGVHWGKCLRVRVKIDIARKLIRGRKIKGEDGADRWVLFKYERLPNFCYRCGLLEHDLKDCPQSKGQDRNDEPEELQYGAWLRRDPVQRSGWEPHYTKRNEGVDRRGKRADGEDGGPMIQKSRSSAVIPDRETQAVQLLGECFVENTTSFSEVGASNKEDNHGNGLVSTIRELPKENLAILVKDGEVKEQATNEKAGGGHEEVVKGNKEAPLFKFEHVAKDRGVGDCVGSDTTSLVEGPMAMMYEMEMGWVSEKLGPTSGHWKRRARAAQTKGKEKETSPIQKKRGLSIPLRKLDQNVQVCKRKKVERQGGGDAGKENETVGGVAVAARQHRRAS